MGNDSSNYLNEYLIDSKGYAQIGQWALHCATKKSNNEQVTVFVGKLKSYGQLSREFQRAIECLKIIRHPTVLKYLHSCISGDVAYLFVEFVKPLGQVLNAQNEQDICEGLHNILLAIDFINTKANIVHNNICKDAVFVSNDGQWKLGYFDLSCSSADFSETLLDQIRSFRYDKSVPPEDEGKRKIEKELIWFRDLFGYGQLVKETIDKCLESAIPNAETFSELASKQMKHAIPQSRGHTSELLKHPFFNQPLLEVHNFLSNIAIKSSQDKAEFFQNLPPILFTIPESLIGLKLINLLLSRLVVLNPSAQQYLLPHLLIPKTESGGLFSPTNYAQFVLPVISRIFPVRDSQIRLILLQYFPHYVYLFDKQFLEQQLLPEILLGIRDTNDNVVSATLKALADLVPILGSSTVIGGTRIKLFTDGMPKLESSSVNSQPLTLNGKGKLRRDLIGNIKTNSLAVSKPQLPERHAPDGGEDGEHIEATLVQEADLEQDEDTQWSDWEAEDLQVNSPAVQEIVPQKPESKDTKTVVKKTFEEDLSALDIQVKLKKDEFDYFADMEPTIVTTAHFAASEVGDTSTANRFDFVAQDQTDDQDGWNWDD